MQNQSFALQTPPYFNEMQEYVQNTEQFLLGITRNRVGQHCLAQQLVSLTPSWSPQRAALNSEQARRKTQLLVLACDPSVCIDPFCPSFVVSGKKESLGLPSKA